MREEVLASPSPQDAGQVAADMLGPVPEGKPVWYQKHMAHHMLEGFPLDWMEGVTNVFLLRSPERVLASYAQKAGERDAGRYRLCRPGGIVRAGRRPAGAGAGGGRGRRCAPRSARDAVGAVRGDRPAFDEAMLRWAPGQHRSDGVWAPHWYGAVFKTTGFAPPEEGEPELPEHLRAIAAAARPFYEKMRGFKLAAPAPAG